MSGTRNAFVGRTQELDGLEAVIQGSDRLMTLVGPAGVGKTRLARALFARLKPSAYFCRLEDARTKDEALGVLARALDLQGGPGLEERLSYALRTRGRCVLILDNLEQITEVFAQTVDALLEASANLTVVATSREVLKVPGERVVHIAPLQVNEGVELFQMRAQELLGAQLDAPRETIERIVTRLDGLPLAIELAAARAKILTPDEILTRLSQRFELLKGGFRVAPPRQRALAAAFDWSWELLAQPERLAFAQCGVFEGRFTAKEAEAIIGDEALDLIQSLTEKSLLRIEGTKNRRFSMLDSTRAYARARLKSMGLLDESTQKHARYYAQFTKTLGRAVEGQNGPEVLDELVGMLPNLIAAVRCAAASPTLKTEAIELLTAADPALSLRESPQTRLSLAETVLRGAPEEPQAKLLCARSLLSMGAPTAALDLLDPAALGEALCADHLLERTRVLLQLGRVTEAQDALEQALLLTTDDRALTFGKIQVQLGRVCTIQGRFEPAREHQERALSIFREAQSPWNERVVLPLLGFLQQSAGQNAKSTYEQARAIARAFKDRDTEGRVVGYLGNVARRDEAVQAAAQYYREAIALLRSAGNKRFEGVFLMDQGILWLDRQRPEEARRLLQQALELELATSERRAEMLIRGYLAAVEAPRDQDVARGHLLRAQRILDDRGDPMLRRFLELQEAHLTLAEGRLEDAAAQLDLEDQTPDHIHFARRILKRALAVKRQRSEDVLLAQDGTWFRVADAPPVDLKKRANLARMLSALGEGWLSAPGEPKDVATLFQRGWPDEQAREDAVKNRVRVGIASLRSAGLKDAVFTERGGYLLDPDRRFVISDQPLFPKGQKL